MKLKFYLAFVFVTLMFVGVGCSNKQPNLENEKEQETKNVVYKKPKNSAPLEDAYFNCIKEGYKIQTGFDSQKKEVRVMCIFENDEYCDAVDFLQKKCGPKKLSLPGTSDSILQNIRICNEQSPAVCGVDGRNYANACVAALSNVEILHEKICTLEEQKNNLVLNEDESIDEQNQTNSAVGAEIAAPPKKTNTTYGNSYTKIGWLNILVDLIELQKPKNPRYFVEECDYKTTVVYYVSNGVSTNFSLLYNNKGEVLCYPNNDLNKECPEFFDKNNRKAYCSAIWKDKR